jgi:predicted DNA binding CopG/RHH family protein
MYNNIMKRAPAAKEQATMKHTTIRLTEALMKRVKIRAVEEGTTFQALLTQALEEYLRGHKKQG